MKKIKTSLSWIILILCIIVGLSILIFTFTYSTNLIKNSNKDKVDIEYEYLLNNINTFENDRKAYLHILSNYSLIVNYLKNSNIDNEKEVIKFFKEQMKKLDLIMQIRILSLNTEERIRLYKKDNNINIVSKTQLQNKSTSEYFNNFMKLKEGEMGISSLDLNMENGKVEIPFRATLRLAMPIFDKKNKIGLIILNYDMNKWLEKNLTSHYLNVNLIDKDGYFILNSNKKDNWSRYKDNKLTIENRFNISLEQLNSLKYKNNYENNFIVKKLNLWNNDIFYVIYSFKSLKDTNLFINQSKIIGISIIIALLILILPFIKIIYEYIHRLKESENKISKILDNSLESILMINQKGIIQTVNNTTVSTFGYAKEELIGKNINILIPEPHHSKHDSYLLSPDKNFKLKSLKEERELFGINKNKKLIPISLSVSEVIIEKETFFIGSIKNIESEIETKKLFENVFNESPVGIALFLNNETFWRVNEKFLSILGYTNKELTKLTFKDITYKKDLKRYICFIEKLKTKDIDKFSIEKRYIHKNGNIIWANLSVTPLYLDVKKEKIEYFIGIIEDITEKKITYQQLLKAEKISLLGHWDWNIKDNKLYWSDMMLEIFGIKEDDSIVTYDDFINIVHPEDREFVHRKLHNSIEKNVSFDIEYRIVVDDKIKVINAKGNTKYLDEKPLNVFGTCQDITLIKELQIKDKNQEHLLMQQAKLVSMGEMVAAIAHQWRQPLNSVGLAVQDLIPAFKHNEIDEEYLIDSRDEIMGQLSYMSKTIDEFRNFFTKSNKIVEFNIIESLKEIISFYWAQLKEHSIQINIYIYINNKKYNVNELNEQDFMDYKINSRVSELKQLIINCISNSKDAIVKLENADNINNIINILVTKKIDNSFDIEITDYAGGIPLDVQDRIFEPYFTTKEMGTGLGLYISSMVMKKSLRGSISYFDSEYKYEGKEYKGSTFKLNISSIS